METSLCSISAGNQVYFLSTDIAPDGNDPSFGITLIEASTLKAWKGTFGDLDENARSIDLKEAELVDLTRKALTRQNMGEISFEYQVSPKANKVELSWKKVVSSVKFQLGKVTLKPVSSPPNTMQDILLYTIQNITDLKGSIYRLESENDRLSNERNQALKRLEKCVVQKEKMEEDLYSKFAVILNEKKAKIRELKSRPADATLDDVEDGDGGQSSSHRSEEKRDDESDEAMDIGDDDTDEERKREESTRKRQKRNTAPSSRRAGQGDDSLVFDQESPENTTTKARRRRREPVSRKPASSQKPAIPKVPSGGTPSTSRTPSMTKTPSRERSQTDTENVDDLLDDF